MRSNALKRFTAARGQLAIVLLGSALAAVSFAQQPANPPQPATGQQPSQPSPQPVTAQQKKPPPKLDSFKPSEEVRADTILTLPSDI